MKLCSKSISYISFNADVIGNSSRNLGLETSRWFRTAVRLQDDWGHKDHHQRHRSYIRQHFLECTWLNHLSCHSWLDHLRNPRLELCRQWHFGHQHYSPKDLIGDSSRDLGLDESHKSCYIGDSDRTIRTKIGLTSKKIGLKIWSTYGNKDVVRMSYDHTTGHFKVKLSSIFWRHNYQVVQQRQKSVCKHWIWNQTFQLAMK